MKPLKHQIAPIEKALKYLRDPKRTKPEVIVAPTASGKSFLIAEIAKRWDNPVLVLQPGKELLRQNLEKTNILGGNATVYSAAMGSRKLSHFTYATLGSVNKDAKALKELGVTTVIIDECHSTFSPEKDSMFMKFMAALEPKKVIGLTATPFRLKSTLNGSELKLLTRMRPNFFKGWIDIIQIQDIIRDGWWSKINYETYEFNESGLVVNTTGAEFTEESVKAAIKAQDINNTIYKKVKQLIAEGCPSILVFVDEVETAKRLAEFVPDSAYLAAGMKEKDRDRVVRDFKAGKIKALFNFGILTTGFDYPDLRAIIMGRPTLSLAMYYQIIGRGTRVSPSTGKESFVFIDYCNNVKRFGRVENLTIEEVEGWGWGVFNGDILLTNTPMAGSRKTKEDCIKEANGQKVDVIWFGVHAGKKITDVPIHWIEFMLTKSGFNFESNPRMQKFKKALQEVLERHEKLSFELSNN